MTRCSHWPRVTWKPWCQITLTRMSSSHGLVFLSLRNCNVTIWYSLHLCTNEVDHRWHEPTQFSHSLQYFTKSTKANMLVLVRGWSGGIWTWCANDDCRINLGSKWLHLVHYTVSFTLNKGKQIKFIWRNVFISKKTIKTFWSVCLVTSRKGTKNMST